MGLFSYKSKTKNDSDIKTILYDKFIDNSNDWLNPDHNDLPFLQRIENETLYLESASDEMVVIASTKFKIDYSKDFQIETKVKIQSDSDDCYMSFDFGIRKIENAIRNISGQKIPTTLGDINYFIGYSDSQEVLIAKWKKGKEKYFFREYVDLIQVDDFNVILISKSGKMISYYINNSLIYSKRFEKFPGDGFGFATSPNGKLWVEYIKIEN